MKRDVSPSKKTTLTSALYVDSSRNMDLTSVQKALRPDYATDAGVRERALAEELRNDR
jgi:hypothetical protein